jgi:hypothetical protein
VRAENISLWTGKWIIMKILFLPSVWLAFPETCLLWGCVCVGDWGGQDLERCLTDWSWGGPAAVIYFQSAPPFAPNITRVCWLLEARAVLKRHCGVWALYPPCRHNRIVTTPIALLWLTSPLLQFLDPLRARTFAFLFLTKNGIMEGNHLYKLFFK